MKLLFYFVCLFLQVVDIESMKHILRYNGMTHTRIHTYPDIFESATISFRIQKFSRPHVSGFKSILHVHTYTTHIRIHSCTQDSSGILASEHLS